MYAHTTKYLNESYNYCYRISVGSLSRVPQVVLIKPYLPLMFQIHMHMPLLRTQTAFRPLRYLLFRGLIAPQTHVHINLKH